MMEYYSAMKKDETMPFTATWTDVQIAILSEVGQAEGKISYDITYMWNLKYDTAKLLKKQKKTHTHRKLIVSKGEG